MRNFIRLLWVDMKATMYVYRLENLGELVLSYFGSVDRTQVDKSPPPMK